MKKILISSACFFLASCVQTQAFRGPNGNTAYSMRCGANLSACYEKAGELCPKGYNIIDRATGVAAVPSGTSFIAAPQHSLAIECK
jgi:hypothetical protein